MKTANLHILLFVAFSAILAAGIQAADSLPAPPQPIFDFEATDDIPVIEYTLDQHMLAQRDPTPLLRVYGSGRVRVHFPVYMKKAGDYEMQLSHAELNALLRMLADKSVMDSMPPLSGRNASNWKRHAGRRPANSSMYQMLPIPLLTSS